MSPATPALELGSTLGHFRLVDLLGEGAMGTVFAAEDIHLGRKVALKVIQPHIAKRPGTRERFLREARTAAQVKHDRIVTIYEVGEDRGVPYIAMELLHGSSLQDQLEGSPLPLDFALQVTLGTVEGLAAAHGKGLIHRDIKPSNIWLETQPGGGFRVKILDFGLARVAEGDAISTHSGQMMGTPSFMSPEQWRGKDVDQRTDLYSVGVMLYQLAAGRVPFVSDSHANLMFQVLQEAPPAIEQVVRGLPPALCELIGRLLAKDKTQRLANAEEVAESLRAILKTVTPKPTTTYVRDWQAAHADTQSPLKTQLSLPKRSVTARYLPWLVIFAGLAMGIAGIVIGSSRPKAVDRQEEIGRLLAGKQMLETEIDRLQARLNGQVGLTEEEARQLKEYAGLVQAKEKLEGERDALQKKITEAEESLMNEQTKRMEESKVKIATQAELANLKVKLIKAETKLLELALLAKNEYNRPDGLPINPKPGDEIEIEVGELGGRSLKMKFCWIPPSKGKVKIGSPQAERDAVLKAINEKEDPEWFGGETGRDVDIDTGFYIGKYEVTQEEYECLTTENRTPSRFTPDNEEVKKARLLDTSRFPVEQVSWIECDAYAKLLTQKHKTKGWQFGLPKEDQWEYACRGGKGNQQAFYFGDSLNGKQANCDGNFPFGTQPEGPYLERTSRVGSYEKEYPHPWGLCDMHGNVWEWCADKYDSEQKFRVLRGGSWYDYATKCRSAYRNGVAAGDRGSGIGFRVILSLD